MQLDHRCLWVKSDAMKAISKTVGVVLAGGQSRRMGGGDKALLAFGHGALIGNAIQKLKSQVSEVVINANGDAARFAQFGMPVVADTIGVGAGPLAGILAGMRWAAANRDGIAFIATSACDTPFFPGDLVEGFIAQIGENDRGVAIAASRGCTHQAFGLWPVALADDLEDALASGTRKVLDWARRHGAVEVCFDDIEAGRQAIDPFFNANTPEELAAANAFLARLEGSS